MFRLSGRILVTLASLSVGWAAFAGGALATAAQVSEQAEKQASHGATTASAKPTAASTRKPAPVVEDHRSADVKEGAGVKTGDGDAPPSVDEVVTRIRQIVAEQSVKGGASPSDAGHAGPAGRATPATEHGRPLPASHAPSGAQLKWSAGVSPRGVSLRWDDEINPHPVARKAVPGVRLTWPVELR